MEQQEQQERQERQEEEDAPAEEEDVSSFRCDAPMRWHGDTKRCPRFWTVSPSENRQTILQQHATAP